MRNQSHVLSPTSLVAILTKQVRIALLPSPPSDSQMSTMEENDSPTSRTTNPLGPQSDGHVVLPIDSIAQDH